MVQPIVAHTTRPAPEVTKRIVPKAGPETPRARRDRLVATARLNGVRVKNNHDGTFTVPSQQRNAAGQPLCRYTVRVYPGLGLLCSCLWAAGDESRGLPGHGLYCAENLGACCAHTACVEVYQERAAAEEARMAKALAQTWARLAEGQAETMQDRRALAGARLDPETAYAELFGGR